MDSTEDRPEQAFKGTEGTEPTEGTEVADLSAGSSEPAAGDLLYPPDGIAAQSSTPPALAKWLAIYTVLRVGILVVVTGLLFLLGLPLILALLFAVVLALPLSWLLFGGVRKRVNEALAVRNVSRRAERERLRSALNGDDRR